MSLYSHKTGPIIYIFSILRTLTHMYNILSDYRSLTFGSSSSLVTLPRAALVRKQSQVIMSQVSSLQYQEIREAWSENQVTRWTISECGSRWSCSHRNLPRLPDSSLKLCLRPRQDPLPTSRPVPSSRRLSRWFFVPNHPFVA